MQQEIIQVTGVKPVIDPAQEVSERVSFLKAYLKHTGAKGFVLGISGGQDSSLAGRLCQLAVEELRKEEGKDVAFTQSAYLTENSRMKQMRKQH